MKPILGVLFFIAASTSIVPPAHAGVTFYKAADIVNLVASGYSGDVFFLYEEANKKYRLELCHYGSSLRHGRFQLAPAVNSAVFCIFAEGQIFKFPMPKFENRSIGCSRPHSAPCVFNEFEVKDLSAEEPALEVSWTGIRGDSSRKLFNGKDQIAAIFKRVDQVINSMKPDAAPQLADVFGDGEMIVTKGDVIELKTKIKGIISAFNLKVINGTKPDTASTTSPSDQFTGTGQQGMASFDFSQNDGVFTIRNGSETFKTKWSRYTSRRVYAHADLSRAVGGRPEFTVFPMSLGLAKTLDYTAKIRNLAVGEVVVFQNREGKYVAVKILEINDKQSGAPENSLTIKWKVL